MIKLEVLRLSSQHKTTLGALFDVTCERKFLCWTLEDPFRKKKIKSETRIPAGTYTVILRTVGGHDARYRKRFPEFHKGMLWLQNVPNFKYILIHCGYTHKDTAGCLIVGDDITGNIHGDGKLPHSSQAYKRIYPPIADAIMAGEKVTIQYIDYDKPLTE